MNFRIVLVALGLFVGILQGPAQSQSQGLLLGDIQIGLDKQTAMSALSVNYELTPLAQSGFDAYSVAGKNSKDLSKGQINFLSGAVVSISEEVGGPYLERDALTVVRNLYEVLAPYSGKTSDYKNKAMIEVEFERRTDAGFGDVDRISFNVEPGKQISIEAITDDAGAPSVYLSVFRKAR